MVYEGRKPRSQIEIKLRRERVKAMLLDGMSPVGIAEEVGCSRDTIDNDVRVIGSEAILKRSEDVVDVAYAHYQSRVDWATDEAQKIFDFDRDEDDNVKLKALDFVVKQEKVKLDVAQSLGLLEKAAEKKEVKFDLDMSPEKIKEIGDYIAIHGTGD